MTRHSTVHHYSLFIRSITVIGLGPRWPWSKAAQPPDSASYSARQILLASEGRRISQAAIAFAVGLAKNAEGQIHVLSIARIWGTSLGLFHPGLMPNSREWRDQHDIVAEALDKLVASGLKVSGQVLSSRNAGKQILTEARRRKADAIVMGADRPCHWLLNDLLWSQEPYRIRRLSPVPVYLLEEPPPSPTRV
jgi:nucleotide-binding universal stress UspA family protein